LEGVVDDWLSAFERSDLRAKREGRGARRERSEKGEEREGRGARRERSEKLLGEGAVEHSTWNAEWDPRGMPGAGA
jgi:hypothetical protein